MLEETDSAVQKYREVGKDKDVCLKTDPYMCNVIPTIYRTHGPLGISNFHWFSLPSYFSDGKLVCECTTSL